MKEQSIKGLLLIVSILLLLSGLIFSILAIFNAENWLFRIIIQGSIGLLMLVNGVHISVYQNQKVLGYFTVGVSVFLFIVMVDTICTAFAIGIF